MQRFDIRRDDGQTMAEYGVILAVVTAAILTALVLLAGSIVDAMERVSALLP